MKTTTNGRAHLLRLQARNVKTLREIVIDEFGELLEIRGDTGQGKTSILESIEGGLKGLDPSMVRQGSDAAEIILELDSARIQRIVYGDGRKDSLTVTDPASGKPIERAKDFLKTLCSESMVFRPLEFVLLGGGESRGRTERLRQQRNMILDAMPVRLNPKDVAQAAMELGEEVFQEAAGVSLDEIDWEQHGLAVCSSLEKIFYDARKAVNANAEDAEGQLRYIEPPTRQPPRMPLAECQQLAESAQQALFEAQAAWKAREGTMRRRDLLVKAIEELRADLPDLDVVKKAKADREERMGRIDAEMAELRARLLDLEQQRDKSRKELDRCEVAISRHDRLAAHRSELEELDGTLDSQAGVDVEALEKAWREASEAAKAREQQDIHDAAAGKAAKARERAKAFDALVQLFRDTLPKRIVEQMDMPVVGLGIEDGVVTFKGIPLHQLGTSEQLRIAVLLAAALNPRTGFVLVDRAESLGSKDRLALAEAARELDVQLVLTFVDPMATPSAGVVVMRDGERAK